MASIEYFHELLLLIRDMASSVNDQQKQNAKILQAKVFSLDIFKLIKFGLEIFEEKKHPIYFLQTMLRFSDLAIIMIDEYSKGWTLTIQTHWRKRVKKAWVDEGMDEEIIGDAMNLISDEEDEDEEVAV